jgi:hypothetical protein
MISIFLGLTLAGTATAQIVNGWSSVAASAYGVSTAAASQVTSPPSSTINFYQQMPYSSFMSGGYQSLKCGYGYYKGSDGSCQTETWVRHCLFIN